MISSMDRKLGAAIGVWVDRAQRHARAVVAGFLLFGAASGLFALSELGLQSDEMALFDRDVPFIQAREALGRTFPRLLDPIVVVLEGPGRDGVDQAARELTAQLHARPGLFPSVYQPGGGPFFEEHGLLYLTPEELEAVADSLRSCASRDSNDPSRLASRAASACSASLLLLLWRSARDAALVAAPLALAALLTVGCAVAIGLPLNFANVIVVPLLLGMGVDSGIHMVHRVRGVALPSGNLLATATARAVLLSALTTLASFGALGLSSHLGLASLGQLLALGITLILLCNLGVLPALVVLTESPGQRSVAGRRSTHG